MIIYCKDAGQIVEFDKVFIDVVYLGNNNCETQKITMLRNGKEVGMLGCFDTREEAYAELEKLFSSIHNGKCVFEGFPNDICSAFEPSMSGIKQ